MSNFTNFNLAPFIIETLEELHFEEPTPIQELVIPKALKGNDIIGKSKTGSGKTHAYLLPLLNKLQPELNQVQAVILTPTRELATQVFQMIQPFAKKQGKIQVRLITGGLDRNKMMEQSGNLPHVVIGTPGRIKDIAFTSGKLNITTASTLIIDEADMVLEAGFMEDVNDIAANLAMKLQMLVFSATIPESLEPFLNRYMNNPLVITPSEKEITPSTIHYVAVPTKNRSKNEVLLELVNTIQPYVCIIFASKIVDVEATYRFLRENGVDSIMIHGDLSPSQRRGAMKRINAHDYKYVIASDIASRGIDVEGVSHIINIDYPGMQEFFFHRAGRTARMNQDGICINIYDKEDLEYLRSISQSGIIFTQYELQNHELVNPKPLFRVKPVVKRKENPELSVKIKKLVAENKPKKVKPGYKKKIKYEIDKLKQKEKRKLIKKDIQRQIKERAVARSKAENHDE